MNQDQTDLIEMTRGLAVSGAEQDMHVGSVFGRYRIVRVLGSGGMGAVYLAEQSMPIRRRVAIKIMRWRTPGAELRLHFEMERQALARMRHPGIAQIFDAGATPEGVMFFVMEYIEGVALGRWLAEHQPGLAVRIRILEDIGRALAHAHQRSVLHCDLKPSNVLITEVDGRPTPKLIDFGIARTLGNDAIASGGTPGYMSPEQFDRNAALDTRSDVYALGVLLAESLSGQRYRAGHDEEPAPQSPPSASFDPLKLPFAHGIEPRPRRAAELRAIVSRALSDDREQRYGGAQALVDDLQRWVEDEPVAAYGGGAFYRFGCFLRRNHRLSLAIAIAMLMVATLIWQLSVQLQRTRLQRDRAEQITELLTDLFRAADPYAHPEGSVSARELLSLAPEQIKERHLDPTVEAQILQTLGDVQYRLDLYADADVSLTRALALERAHDARAAATGETSRLLARNALSDERYDKAAAQLEGIVAAAQRNQDDAALGDALVIQAELELYRGDLDAAERALERATPVVARVGKVELSQQLARYLGRLAFERAQYPQAVEHLVEAVRIAHGAPQETPNGEVGATLVNTLSDLAMAQSRAGQLDAAESTLREVLAGTRRRFGENSISYAIDLDNLGTLLQRNGTPDALAEAERHSRAALDILRRHPDVAVLERATAANNLARTLELQGQPGQALAVYAEALPAMRKAVGEAHALTGIVLHNLGRAQLAVGDLEQAGDSLRQAGTILAASLGESHSRYAVWRVTQAEYALRTGDVQQSRQQLDSACATYRDGAALDPRERRRLFDIIGRLAVAAPGPVVECGIALPEPDPPAVR